MRNSALVYIRIYTYARYQQNKGFDAPFFLFSNLLRAAAQCADVATLSGLLIFAYEPEANYMKVLTKNEPGATPIRWFSLLLEENLRQTN